ncbi:uncharacterized protein VTP21DRAFT_4955 [Calcarisporiella thermophila]|uniref:uncharacterized protein n=1 Tax=Calcarisporiella thermophila TaxID=911321 RepID=UPI003744579B
MNKDSIHSDRKDEVKPSPEDAGSKESVKTIQKKVKDMACNDPINQEENVSQDPPAPPATTEKNSEPSGTVRRKNMEETQEEREFEKKRRIDINDQNLEAESSLDSSKENAAKKSAEESTEKELKSNSIPNNPFLKASTNSTSWDDLVEEQGSEDTKNNVTDSNKATAKPGATTKAITPAEESTTENNSALKGESKPAVKGFGFKMASTTSPFTSFSSGKTSESPFSSLTSFSSKKEESNGQKASPFAASNLTSEKQSFDSLLSSSGTGDDKGEKDDKLAISASMIGSAPKSTLQEQEVITGEEDEEMLHQLRAKLYAMDDERQWKERGVGNLRINVSKENPKAARLVMRADGVLRVILNVAIFSGMSCELSQEKFVRLIAFENSKPVHFAIKAPNKNAALDLFEAIQDRLEVVGQN